MKYFKKMKIKSGGLTNSLLSLFSFFIEPLKEIEPINTFSKNGGFKTMLMAFNGKSSKEIKEWVKLNQISQEEKIRQKALEQLNK